MRFILAFVASVLALIASIPAVAAPVLLLSADAEGHVTACSACPNHQGFGGLERRATVITGIRAKESLLLVDAGNWLAGTESIGSHGQIIVAAYDDMAYDVVH